MESTTNTRPTDAFHLSEPGWSMAPQDPLGGPPRDCDVLFVHGMASGGWIWKPDFLDRFRATGYRVWTLTLPGRLTGPTLRSDPSALPRATRAALHADSTSEVLSIFASILPGAGLIDGPDLDDFADILDRALAAVGRPCAIVGHSLGGAVAQNHARRHGWAHGTALICSVPPYGMWRASAQMALTNPPLWKALFDYSLFGLAHADHDVMRDNLFPNGVSERDYMTFVTHLRDESLAATSAAGGIPPFAPPPGLRDDVLVVGTGRDRLVPALDIWLTAAWYGNPPVFLSDAGHMPMLEDSRTRLADTLVDWLDRL
ncbi:alpha/beta fold hydrolase [Marinibacterium sp. SX1]|uniref:alpha/beta fold hydrolase n=1 Tax=Marinibacterium sp. SX1 TaxID=3388424 RepID=UPI003D1842C0